MSVTQRGRVSTKPAQVAARSAGKPVFVRGITRAGRSRSMTSDSRQESVRAYLLEAANVQRLAADECGPAIVRAAELVAESFRQGGKLLLCGNGGSAADCQHLATEFTSRLSAEFVRPALPALALTTDTSFLTAYPNDYDFDGVFS